MDESDGFAAKKPKLDISFNAELSSNDGVVAKKPRLSECSNMQIVDVAVKEPSPVARRLPYGPDHSFIRYGNKYHLLLCVTGSVATIKLKELIDHLIKLSPSDRLDIRIVATDAARRFFDENSLSQIVYTEADEWNMWQNRGDPILHIELRNWADAMLIAPLDANTLAKIANGLCDNLLTCVVRAWHPNKQIFFAPAMNAAMWENPITHQHRRTLRDFFHFREIPPIEKQLMCGDQGCGAMATIQMIASIVASDVKNRFAVYSDNSKL